MNIARLSRALRAVRGLRCVEKLKRLCTPQLTCARPCVSTMQCTLIARGPIELAPLRKLRAITPSRLRLAPRRLAKAITSTDKPSRSAAELYGERDYCSVVASQLDWASQNEYALDYPLLHGDIGQHT